MASILVVDDEVVCRKYLPLFLREDGHDVRAVGTAREAIELASRFPPDVLVTDWLLKDAQDGIDVARALVQQLPGLKVIFMTGLPRAQLAGQVADLPVLKIIEKPLDLDEVLEEIRALLRGA